MTSGESVLVVAFDGLDRELIERWQLSNLMQSEFGSINNHEGIDEIKTSELFISFISGVNHKEHGCTGLGYSNSEFKSRVIKLIDFKHSSYVPGYVRFLKAVKKLINLRGVRYSKEDYDNLTLFDEIRDSKALFVPGYNPSVFWKYACGLQPLREKGSLGECKRLTERDFEFRLSKLNEDLDSDNHRFLMCHFHMPDTIQHLYTDNENIKDEDEIRELYERMDKVAGEIKSKSGDYDKVIFMSDHGLPKIKDHNRNAFYSCNKPLFDSEVPHITDFYGEIKDSLNASSEVEGIDI